MAQSDYHPDPKTGQGRQHRQALSPHQSSVPRGKNAGRSPVAKNNHTHPFPPCSTWPSAEKLDMHCTVDDHRRRSCRLLKKQHSELISKQFALAYHLPQHPCHQLCLRPPDDLPGRQRSMIDRFKPNIQQYLAEVRPNNTSYKWAIIQDTVRTAIENSSSKLLNGRPPPIATAEQTLSRKTRTILEQLRTGHNRKFCQYINGIDSTKRNHYHDCGHSPHDIHHLFDYPSKPTTLTVELLWSAPTETAKHLNLAIYETS